MFTDEAFQGKASVDKRGRKVSLLPWQAAPRGMAKDVAGQGKGVHRLDKGEIRAGDPGRVPVRALLQGAGSACRAQGR